MGIWLPEIMGLNRAQYHCYSSWEMAFSKPGIIHGDFKSQEEYKCDIQDMFHVTVSGEMSQVMEGKKTLYPQTEQAEANTKHQPSPA